MTTLWRFNFTEKSIDKGKKFLKGTNKTEPSFLKGRKGEIKKGHLYVDGRLVVPKTKQETFIRNKVLSGKVPMSRDGLYYYLSKISVGVSRAAIDKFLKAQHIIRETDTLQPRTKRASRRVLKKGQIAFDLVEINWKDVGFKPTDKNIEKESGYIFTVADALTGLLFAKFAPNKDREIITPVAEEGFKWMVEKLKTPLSKMHGTSDSGGEWDVKKYKEWGLRVKFLKRAPLIEQKNKQIQAALYRIIKMKKTKNIASLVKSAMTVVNRTQSSLTKFAPIEAISQKQTELAEKYNKRRGKDSGVKIKLRPLKIGEFVRLQVIGDKKRGGEFYKAYKGEGWSKRRYKVLKKRGNRYQLDVNGKKKYIHRSELKPTSAADKKTVKILWQRERDNLAKEIKELKKIRDEIDKKNEGKEMRQAKKDAIKKLRELHDRERELDRLLGT